jgi:hypothetical protein
VYDLEPVKCLHIGVQVTGVHSSMQRRRQNWESFLIRGSRNRSSGARLIDNGNHVGRAELPGPN